LYIAILPLRKQGGDGFHNSEGDWKWWMDVADALQQRNKYKRADPLYDAVVYFHHETSSIMFA